MKLFPFATVIASGLLLAAPSLAQDAGSEGASNTGSSDESVSERDQAELQRQAFESRYGALTSNNIFKRDRRPPPPPQPPREQEPPPPPPPEETNWLLVGIVFEGGVPRAYFEHLKEKRLVIISAGDEVANGLLGQVFIDAVSYLGKEGEIIWVDVGDDLTGEAAKLPDSASRTSTASSSGTGEQGTGEQGGSSGGAAAEQGSTGAAAESGGDSDENLSVVERLRRARQAELEGSRQ